MADQGASQRRGLESSITLISQPNTTTPPESNMTSGYSMSFLGVVSNDTTSQEVTLKEASITPVGVATAATSDRGNYSTTSLGQVATLDWAGQAVGPKETGISAVGQTTPETPNHGGYVSSQLGVGTPLFGTGGGTTTTTYYKLRARDTGASYVEWVTTVTPLSTASYPGTPVGTLVELTVLSIVTR